jgi:predicted metal-dependent hydrolase
VELDYTVIYSPNRKKLTITVERDRSVVVRAPEGTSPEKIRQIIESKKQWLYQKTRHPQKYNDLPHPPGKELVNGESLLYLGRHYRIELVENGEEIEFTQKFFIPKKIASNKRAAFQAWYKEKAAEKILPRVLAHAKNLGVRYNQAKIMNSKYQWGSCTPNDNVNFNWRLIKAPMFVIDYVIVHELAHLLEPNHTPRFWNIIRAQIAETEKAKAWLRENGALLELDI